MLEFRKRTARSSRIKKNGNCKCKSRGQKLANCTLRDLAAKLDTHGRHCMLSYLSLFPISDLRSLDTEDNKFYNRTNRLYDAALLTRCYTQHALRPAKGPQCRFPVQIDFQKCREKIAVSLNKFCNRWCKGEHVECDALKDWKLNIFKIIDRRISFYSQNTNVLPRKPKIIYRYLKSGIEEFHRKYWFQ